MRIVSLINDAQIIERILGHVGSGGIDQWVSEICNHGVRIAPSTGPPVGEIIDRGQLVIEPLLDDPMPDYDSNPFSFKPPLHHSPALQSQRESAHRRGGGGHTDHIGDTSVRAHG